MGGKWKAGAQQNERKNRRKKRSVRLNYEGDCKTCFECFIAAGGDGADGEDGEVFPDSPSTAAPSCSDAANEGTRKETPRRAFVRPRSPPFRDDTVVFSVSAFVSVQMGFRSTDMNQREQRRRRELLISKGGERSRVTAEEPQSSRRKPV